VTFEEIKSRLEFGLEVMGVSQHGYKFVTVKEWEEVGKECTFRADSHSIEDAKLCSPCRMMSMPERLYGAMNDDKLGIVVHSLVTYIGKSPQHHYALKG
jgi:hypothetical protein